MSDTKFGNLKTSALPKVSFNISGELEADAYDKGKHNNTPATAINLPRFRIRVDKPVIKLFCFIFDNWLDEVWKFLDLTFYLTSDEQ